MKRSSSCFLKHVCNSPSMPNREDKAPKCTYHARCVQICDPAAVELDNADRVVPIVVSAQVGLHGGDAGGYDGFDEGVLAEEPEG